MTSTRRPDLHEENRRSWNEATKAHNSHKADQAGFLRRGGSTLFPEEVELLGDLHGLTLLHLQCNAGQDTLSLAALGAAVTGVDISDEAVAFARRLSADSGIPATFHRADVYDYSTEAAARGEQYDRVFASYGALPWLSDLAGWAAGVHGLLRPGGRLVVLEFHPVLWLYEGDWQQRVYPYFAAGQVFTEAGGVGDYVARSGDGLIPMERAAGVADFENPHACHAFTWGIGETLTALLEAGLLLERFHEYPYTNGCKTSADMVELPGRRMTLPEGVPNLPLMFGLSARRPA
jgi:SAM-dependent methyltransferase